MRCRLLFSLRFVSTLVSGWRGLLRLQKQLRLDPVGDRPRKVPDARLRDFGCHLGERRKLRSGFGSHILHIAVVGHSCKLEMRIGGGLVAVGDVFEFANEREVVGAGDGLLEGHVRDVVRNFDFRIRSLGLKVRHLDRNGSADEIGRGHFDFERLGAKAASEYVDVVLSGEGSDELFGGYNSYLDVITHQKYMKRPYFIRHLAYLLTCKLPETRKRNFIRRRGQKLENFHIGLDRVFRDDKVNTVLKNKSRLHTKQVTRKYYDAYKDSTGLQKRQIIDYYFWLVNDFVHSVTASASAFGMQARFPFLDSAVYESARTLPDSMKIGPDGTKLALRLAAEGVVPTDAYKRKKLGFPVPLKEWMKEELYYNEIKKAFTSETAKRFFKEKAILKLLDDHRNEVCDCYKKIWTIYTFIVWYDLYFN